MVRSDKRSMVWVCLWGMELEGIMPVRLIEEQCTLKYWLSEVLHVAVAPRECAAAAVFGKGSVSHEHLQYLRWGTHGFFGAGTTAFLWEVPAGNVILSKVRGENWTQVLLLVWLIDELLFSPGVPAAALLLPQPYLISAGRWLCSCHVQSFAQLCNSWCPLLPLNVGNYSGSLTGQFVLALCMATAKQLRMSGSQ